MQQAVVPTLFTTPFPLKKTLQTEEARNVCKFSWGSNCPAYLLSRIQPTNHDEPEPFDSYNGDSMIRDGWSRWHLDAVTLQLRPAVGKIRYQHQIRWCYHYLAAALFLPRKRTYDFLKPHLPTSNKLFLKKWLWLSTLRDSTKNGKKLSTRGW